MGRQEVTGGYKRLQGVTRAYSRLQIYFFLTKTTPKTDSWSVLNNNTSWINLQFLTKTVDLPLLKTANFEFFINRCSSSLERLLYYPEFLQTLFLHLCLINRKDEKTSTFWPSHDLTSFEKSELCGFLKSMFLLSRKGCFLTRTSPSTSSRCILHNTKSWQNLKFLTKTLD